MALTVITVGGDGTFSSSAAHAGLHDGQFEPLHGHTFTVTLRLHGEPDQTGMVCDFSVIKAALVSLNSDRPRSLFVMGFQGTGDDTISQNSLSRATRFSGALPAMMAALMAPIEMPATQAGSKSKWHSA